MLDGETEKLSFKKILIWWTKKLLFKTLYFQVGHARVAVKEMDGQPALFNN